MILSKLYGLADIRMAYGAAYPKTSTPSYIEVSSAGSRESG